MNRKRNLHFHAWLTADEKELIKTVAKLKGFSITDLIVELVRKEDEKIKEETNNEA